MSDHKLFYYPYTPFTTAQLPLLKVAALYFDKRVILDPVGASRATIGADLFENPGFSIQRCECAKQTYGGAAS